MRIEEKSAGVVVFRKIEGTISFLIIRNSSHKVWDFPKGNIEEGENEEQAAMREMKEEAGLEKVKIIPGFKETMNYYYKRDGNLVSKEVVMFLGEEKNIEEVKLSWEHDKYVWAELEGALEIVRDKKKDVLVKAYEFLSGRLDNFTKA